MMAEKPETTAVDAEQWNITVSGQAAGIQHRAVTTDRNHQIRTRSELGLGAARDGQVERILLGCQYFDASFCQMHHQRRHGSCDALVVVATHQCYFLKLATHSYPVTP